MAKRVLDAEFERAVQKRVDAEVKKMKEGLSHAKHIAIEGEEKFEAAVREKPMMYVAGAFVAGLLVGKLLSSRS